MFKSSVNMVDRDAAFEVEFFKHELILPGENKYYGSPNLPRRHSRDGYKVRRTMGLGMCWETRDGALLRSYDLADKIQNDYWSVYEDSVVNPLDLDR